MNKVCLTLFAAFVLWGCSKEKGVIPSYVYLTEWSFTTQPDQGSSHQIIKSAHVFVNGSSIGVYQVPSLIPVIAEGDVDFFILPMVKRNGMQDLDDVIPYFEPFETTLQLSGQNTRDTLHLATHYRDFTEFVIIEDFEGGYQFRDDLDGNDSTRLTRFTGEAFEGVACGKMVVTESNPVLEEGYNILLSNTQGHGSYWLEMTYKTNLIFVVGVQSYVAGIQSKNYSAGVNVREEWNTIYFDLTDLLTTSENGLYQLVLVCLWTSLVEEEGTVLVDNIKLIRTK